MNYRRVIYVDGKSHMAQAIQEAKIHEGPVLIHLKVDSAVPPKLPRPTRKPFRSQGTTHQVSKSESSEPGLA